MDQYRQGIGAVKTVKATGPETRVDGTSLARNEVDHFEFDLEFQGGLAVSGLPVQQSDDPNTPEWDGSFSETLDIDSLEPGVYTLRYRTVDVNGLMSANSQDYSMEVLPPLAVPSPPTNISVS